MTDDYSGVNCINKGNIYTAYNFTSKYYEVIDEINRARRLRTSWFIKINILTPLYYFKLIGLFIK